MFWLAILYLVSVATALPAPEISSEVKDNEVELPKEESKEYVSPVPSDLSEIFGDSEKPVDAEAEDDLLAVIDDIFKSLEKALADIDEESEKYKESSESDDKKPKEPKKEDGFKESEEEKKYPDVGKDKDKDKFGGFNGPVIIQIEEFSGPSLISQFFDWLANRLPSLPSIRPFGKPGYVEDPYYKYYFDDFVPYK